MSSTFHKCLGLYMQSFLLWSQDHALPFIPFAYVHPLTCLLNWINLMYTSATVWKHIQCIVSLLQLVRQNVMPRFFWFSSFIGLIEAGGNWHPWGRLEDLSLKPISGARWWYPHRAKNPSHVVLICILPFPSLSSSCSGGTFRFHRYWRQNRCGGWWWHWWWWSRIFGHRTG